MNSPSFVLNNTSTPESPIVYLPKIHSHNISNFSSRASLIPKIDLSRAFYDYHKQKITSFTKDSDSTSVSQFHDKTNSKTRSKSPKKNNNEIQDLTSLYALNEQDLFALALQTLQKAPSNRSESDIKVISLSTENVKFFQEYDSQTHAECCRYMTWEHGKSHTTLFEAGSVGTKFYITLKGVVGIWVNLPKIVMDEHGRALEQKEYVPTEVKTLGPGCSFGELALLDNRPRAATIKCREDCEFAVLDKQYFNDILKEKEQKKLFENVDFLSSMKVFHDFSFAALKSLFYHTLEIKTFRKQVIYRKGDDPHSVYIIREGEFLMSLDVEIPMKDLLTDRNGIKKDYIVKTLEMSLLGPGYIFGEEEMMEKQKRKTTVICNSHSAVMYVLSKKEFFRRVFLDDYSRAFLKQNMKIKKKFRENRINEFIETEKLFLVPKGQDLLALGTKNEEEADEKDQEKDKENEIEKGIEKDQDQEKNQDKNKEINDDLSKRIAQRKTLLEEMKKTFVLSEAVKASAYERYRAIKAKYPNKKGLSVDIQEILRKKIAEESMKTPYLKAFMKQKNGNIALKRKIELKEERRNFKKFFREQRREEINKSLENKICTDPKEEIKPGFNLFILQNSKDEKRKKDPFRKVKSISMHEKGNELEMLPLKYNVENIMKKKTKRFVPALKQPFRGYSF